MQFIHPNITLLYSGRIAGIEPASSPWKVEVLPLNYIRTAVTPIPHRAPSGDVFFYCWEGQANKPGRFTKY